MNKVNQDALYMDAITYSSELATSIANKEFQKQTSPDSDGYYYIYWMFEGIMFKTKHNLFI